MARIEDIDRAFIENARKEQQLKYALHRLKRVLHKDRDTLNRYGNAAGWHRARPLSAESDSKPSLDERISRAELEIEALKTRVRWLEEELGITGKEAQ